MTDREENVQMILEEVWNKGDLGVVEQAFHPSARFFHPNTGEVSKEGLKAYVKALREGFPDGRFEMVRLVSEADYDVLHWRFSGTHSGNYMGLEPTNKKLSFDGLTMSRMEGERIVEERVYFDTLGTLQQLGVVPDVGLRPPAAQEAEVRA